MGVPAASPPRRVPVAPVGAETPTGYPTILDEGLVDDESVRFRPGTLRVPVLLAAVLVACNVGLYQGPDRPDDQDVLGPPPPAEFHCERGERRREDTDHDGRPDRLLYVLSSGEVLCSTEDRNHDGKIDTWNRFENGKLTEQATDTNLDGTLDQIARDTKGSGTLDSVTPFTPASRVTVDAGPG